MDPNQDRRVQAAFDDYVDKATAWDQCQKARADERRKVWLEAADLAEATKTHEGAKVALREFAAKLRALAEQ